MASRQTPRRPGQEADGHLASEVFRLFPHGILVLDDNGCVVAANGEAGGLLDPGSGPEADLSGRSCCELLGCGGEGPLAESCLTEVAMEYGERLPEMRLDLPSGLGAAWVTAARLGAHPQVVLEVRPGDLHDRRRRTEPHWTGAPELRISALGRTRVESKEGSIGGAWLEQRPGQILKLLVCERHRVVPAEAIAEAIWPGAGPRSIANLRQCIHELRDRLEPDRPRRTPSSFVVLRQGGYVLDRRRIRIDADDFERHVEEGLKRFSDGDAVSAVRALRKATELYEGDLFAEDPYAEWASMERDRLRDLAVRALRVLGEEALSAGKLAVAAMHLRKLADLEPYDVAIQRRLIEVFVREGRRSEAHRRYTALQMRMQRDFGEELDFHFGELTHPSSGQLRLV
jgi:DNA-binding SARP family transcriptional activator